MVHYGQVTRALVATALSIGWIAASHAETDKYGITPAERAACQQDATLLCSYTYPDEDKLLACMRRSQTQLSASCLETFRAGLKRRHMAF